MVTQRCALTVQLQPFMTHIPGLLASTMHIRNVRYHRNTEHTIARSHLISPSKALNTLRLALISTIPDRAVRSSPADQRWFLASFITIRSLTLRNSTFARSDSNELIDSLILKTLCLQVSPTCILYPLGISSTDRFRVWTEREVHLFSLSICNDQHSTLHERKLAGNCARTTCLSRYARGRFVVEENEEKRGSDRAT